MARCGRQINGLLIFMQFGMHEQWQVSVAHLAECSSHMMQILFRFSHIIGRTLFNQVHSAPGLGD